MKITEQDFKELKEDCYMIMNVNKKPETMEIIAYMWMIFHEVWFQRQSPNTHPLFIAKPERRILLYKSRDYWLTRLYEYMNI